MKKVIIVSRRLNRKGKLINWVSEIYLQLMVEHQVMPVIVPIAEGTPAILNEYLDDYQGLLMMEGGDLGPHYYGENYKIDELDEYDALKDEIETACFRHAYEHQKAILGFCRGMHIINGLLGGANYQDIQVANQNKVLHMDYSNYDGLRHPIEVFENTPLFKWYGEKKLMVNSYHHQGIKRIAPVLQPMAKASDGLIEGIYHPERNFVVGLQFHPERMLSEYKGNYRVFEAFFDAVKNL